MSFTKLQIITKVELDLDLQEETIIAPTEMTGYLNDAIRDARAIILTIDPDYFLTPAAFPIVLGTKDYDLPAGIYATKIRSLEYDNGSKQYEIKRIKNYKKFNRIVDAGLSLGSEIEYRYTFFKKATGPEFTLRLLPAATETSSTFITLWFERESNVLSADGDVCDIPEHISYIFAHMKKSCKTKINNGVVPPDAQKEVDDQAELMIDALTDMVEDDDTTIEADYSHYREHS